MRTLLEIECSFFGCIFDDPEARILEAKKEGCEPDWFEDPECRLCWRAVESIYATKTIEDIDFITILNEATRLGETKGSEDFGVEIKPNFYDRCSHYRQGAAAEERSDIHSYSEILRGNCLRRKIAKATAAYQETIKTAKDPFSTSSSFVTDVTSIIQSGIPVQDASIRDLTGETMAVYERNYEEFAVKKNYDYVSGIQMPWKYLTKVMNGLQPGLHIVAARPSVGKTSFILQCALFWAAEGHKVTFDCLDMSDKQVIRRPMANLARVAIDKAEKGKASLEELGRLREAKKTLDDWGDKHIFRIVTEYDVDHLKTKCTIAHAAGQLDILIIDYVQQLRCTARGVNSENDRLTRISSTLKSIAIELNIPVIALSQLSRDNVKDKNGARPPTMADLRGSGSLEQDAFSVTLLYFDDPVRSHWYDNPMTVEPLLASTTTDPEDMVEEIRAIRPVWWDLQKNQNGSTGKCPFVVYNNHFRWYEGYRAGRDEQPPPGAPKMIQLFSKITADWRFDEDPIKTLQQRGLVEFPKYWEYQISKLCKRRGIPVPDEIERKINSSYKPASFDMPKEAVQKTPVTAPAQTGNLGRPTVTKPSATPSGGYYSEHGGQSIEEAFGMTQKTPQKVPEPPREPEEDTYEDEQEAYEDAEAETARRIQEQQAQQVNEFENSPDMDDSQDIDIPF